MSRNFLAATPAAVIAHNFELWGQRVREDPRPLTRYQQRQIDMLRNELDRRLSRAANPPPKPQPIVRPLDKPGGPWKPGGGNR